MQQKENFLKTKKGKIVVGSVGSVVGVLVLYLIIAYIMKWVPFGISINNTDLTTFKADVEKLVADEKATDVKADNNKIVEAVENKINALKTQVEQVNEKRANKKIKTEKIDTLKTEAGKLKDKETKTAFKEEATKFKTSVDKFVTEFKEEIKE
uniref:Immunodominant membrane protein n=1 Tax=Elm yellows phytoplasma TaxID=35774 RepID=A0A7U0TEC6_ELYEP|nr:immunodominant membrane protein [Candidatus Phytoplasma ulmi]